MITHSWIYWITRFDGIKSMLLGFSIMAGIIGSALVILGIIYKSIYTNKIAIETDEGREDSLFNQYKTRHSWIFRNGVRLLATMFALIFVNVLVPNMKEMAAILIIPKVANAEPVQEFGVEFVHLAKDWMNELRPTQVKKTAKAVASGMSSAAKAAKDTATEAAHAICEAKKD